MSKKAILAICIALIIPLTGYLLMKYAGARALEMPKHFLLDSVTTHEENGKISTDSVWHTVKDIRLVNQLGDTVHLNELRGKVLIIDLFFTSCGSICPTLTKHMLKLQKSFEKGGGQREDLLGSDKIQFISLTIDPDRDSVSKLKQYADKYGVSHDNWWFLTGNRDSIYQFIFQELKVDKYDDTTPIDPNFAHTGRFVLIDKDFHVRGYYNGLDTVEALPSLAKAIGLLMVEKDKDHPEPRPFDLETLLVIFAMTIVIVFILAKILFYKKKIK